MSRARSASLIGSLAAEYFADLHGHPPDPANVLDREEVARLARGLRAVEALSLEAVADGTQTFQGIGPDGWSTFRTVEE